MTAPRWRRRPEGSTWGDFGPDDVLGRVNLLTPERVLAAVGEVREGRVFALTLPLDRPGGSALNDRRFPPVVRPNLRAGSPNFNFQMSRLDPHLTDVMSDDLVTLSCQYSTQWDGLGHVGSMFDVDGDGTEQPVYYNGYRAGEHVLGPEDSADAGPGETSTSSATVIGIDTIARTGLQARGVLIDLRKHLGDAKQAVGYDTLRQILAADDIDVRPGDILCFYTGFTEHILAMEGDLDLAALERLGAGLDGRDPDLLQWLTDTQVVALAADNYGVEIVPATEPTTERYSHLPLHEHCIFRLGMPLGELWWLADLARALREAGRHHFLLTAPPLALPGAVGSPVTPVATI